VGAPFSFPVKSGRGSRGACAEMVSLITVGGVTARV